MSYFPKLIFIISGKRKSGKDYVADRLLLKLKTSYNSVIIRLYAPLKEEFAHIHNLDSEELLTTSDYKERYRLDMIKWGEEVRAKDSTYFIRAAFEKYEAKKFPVWIVSDMRRQSDFQWFMSTFGDLIKTVRITASVDTRKSRGFVFTSGVDDAGSECDLDAVTAWDFIFDNEPNKATELNDFLNSLLEICKEKLDSVE